LYRDDCSFFLPAGYVPHASGTLGVLEEFDLLCMVMILKGTNSHLNLNRLIVVPSLLDSSMHLTNKLSSYVIDLAGQRAVGYVLSRITLRQWSF
jgi:hypothetical protein